MADLIDRHDAYVFLTEYYNHRTEAQHKNLKEALSRVPEAVVHCKDCKHYVPYQLRDGYFCFLWEGLCEAEPDDFCSRGEKKGGTND
jgi:hypothetical protein